MFIRHVKIFQEILPTFKYVRIHRILDNWLISNFRFFILYLIIAYFYLFIVLWTHSDLIFSVELSLTIMFFYSSLSVEQTCDNVLSNRKCSDLLSSVEQTYYNGIYFAPVISVLTGNMCDLRASCLIINFEICLSR